MNNRLFSVQDVIKPLVSSWGMLVLGTMLFALLVVGITLIQPLKYSSTVRLLVIQKSDSVVDPYTSSRGAEKIAQLITQIVHSDSFMEKVVSSGFQVRDDYGSDLDARRKKWNKTIEARQVPETAIIELFVYHISVEQARNIVKAASTALQTKASEYHGAGENVQLREIDGAVVSRFPIKPNVILNAIAGVIIGLCVSGGFIVVRARKRADMNEAVRIRVMGDV
ncbi:MAG: hypothetical protein UV70_C0005G0081 [Parcubacteria group bacterium GW2011_GWA2_43_13]|nr:MAG: hypothetical protein UV70_C0005G0081 [Parcubacteria group bacterium GW2011_GWA2_43_13]OGY71410.1 MAG: hypothetical protein A2986_01640 [Candidatus Jacksonbacteria bacterium RIFCSPLOWO2_01_FULL_44_13]HAZ17063.1 hypothetical protein [Candidatus Jacksonbacteria bacterium]